jgi:fatty-acyl-CoA synthase
MVYPSAGFDALATLECIQSERCTVIYGVPTMFIAQLDHPEFDRFDLRSLRTGIMAGSPCPIEVMRRVVERMHAREMTIAYGMTETSPVSFHTSSSDTLDRRVSSVGQIHPHVEAKVVDAEGVLVPRGQRGELCVRGYSVMLGYWDDPEKTAEAIDEQGWMHTGDLVTIDEAGYCNVVGRLKDMIIRGGENVYPREIEEFLFKHPGIADVAVVGLPHEKLGEEVCAWIKLRAGVAATQEEIRAYCSGQLAHYKVPTQVVFVAAFPLTATGKIQKFAIREQMMTRLGRAEQVTA